MVESGAPKLPFTFGVPSYVNAGPRAVAKISHTPGPDGPESAAPTLPQFRIGRAGLTAEFGSSMINRASLKPLVEALPCRTLLVMLVCWRKTVTLTCGTAEPAGVGTPPVQFKVRSPTSSV